MTIIGINLQLNRGEADMVMTLHANGAVVGTGTLTESSHAGYYTANIAEHNSGLQYNVDVDDSGGDPVYTGVLYAGQTVVDVLAAASSAPSEVITGGLFNGADIRIDQDDDYNGQFALVFAITHPTNDYSAIDSAQFAAGKVPGTPLITGVCVVGTKGVGFLNITVTFDKANLQIDQGGYPYTLKAFIGTNRHTVHKGTLTLSPTYLPFSS